MIDHNKVDTETTKAVMASVIITEVVKVDSKDVITMVADTTEAAINNVVQKDKEITEVVSETTMLVEEETMVASKDVLTQLNVLDHKSKLNHY